jgi:hypothetical protein
MTSSDLHRVLLVTREAVRDRDRDGVDVAGVDKGGAKWTFPNPAAGFVVVTVTKDGPETSEGERVVLPSTAWSARFPTTPA